MKYFKHETSDRNKVESKLIRKRFGAEGYGIYLALLEVIAEEIDKNNIQDWGYVNKLHTVETLADECATDTETMKKFLQFCDEKEIFEKRDGRLYSSLVLERLDDYTTKLRSKSDLVGQTTELVGLSPDKEKRIEENRKEKKRVKRVKGDEQPFTSPKYLLNVPVEDLEQFHKTYEVSIDQIKTKAEALSNWLVKKGRAYKNYRAALQDCLLKDFGKRKTAIKPKADYVYDEESKSYKQIIKA